MKQKCAIKVVSDDPDVKMELAAIQTLCKSTLPNHHIIQVYDILFREDPFARQTFIQMEFCDGTLETYIEEVRTKAGSLEPIEIVEIMIQVLTGLCHCHTLGFCHRDLKLPNSIQLFEKSLIQFCSSMEI